MSPPRPPAATPGEVHAALASPVRRRLLDVLERGDTPRTVQELGALVGLHLSTVRSHLELLRHAGLVARATRTEQGMGRPPTGYVATTGDTGTPADTDTDITAATETAYQMLVSLLSAHLSDDAEDRAERAERAGADWAVSVVPAQTPPRTRKDAAGHLSAIFAEIGFGPELATVGNEQQIMLRACPFRAVAREHPEVCSVHRGLLRAGLERLGNAGATRLHPFVEPELCLAVIGPNSGNSPS